MATARHLKNLPIHFDTMRPEDRARVLGDGLETAGSERKDCWPCT